MVDILTGPAAYEARGLHVGCVQKDTLRRPRVARGTEALSVEDGDLCALQN